MFKKAALSVAIATLLTAGCGGGSGSSGSGSGTTPQSATVAGPLDPVQTSVKSSVITPLTTATAGTPVQGVLQCADSVVNQNTLDIADAFANGLANPSTLAATTPAEAQAALAALVSNLSGLLSSLGGTAGCTGLAAGSATVPTTDPLAGTPLAPLSAALLPALTSAQQQLAGGAGGSAPLSATQLSSIVAMLSDAYSGAVAQLPGSATSAPIVGGTLVTVGDALGQLKTITAAATSGANPTVLSADLQALAQTVLTDLTTKVVPVGTLQGTAGGGASTDVLAQIQAAVASLTGGLGSAPTTALPGNALGGAAFAPLTGLISQLSAGLPTSLAGSAGSTPLAAALGPVQSLLGSLLAAPGVGGGTTCPLHFLGLC